MAREDTGRNWLKTSLVLAFVLLILLLLLRCCSSCRHTPAAAPGTVDTVVRVDTVYVPVEPPVTPPEPVDSVEEGVYDAVDLVMCIDVTGSMGGIIRTVTNHAVNFCDDLKRKCEENGKEINNFRVRVLAFRDFEETDYPPLEDSGFFNLPEQGGDFRSFASRLIACGGGDGPESGLEAVGVAMNSDWSGEGHSRCRVIMVWTDEVPKRYGVGRPRSVYPHELPADVAGLRNWWEVEKMGGGAKRLVLFAPDTNYWNTIKNTWSDVTLGSYANPRDYDAILETIVDAL